MTNGLERLRGILKYFKDKKKMSDYELWLNTEKRMSKQTKISIIATHFFLFISVNNLKFPEKVMNILLFLILSTLILSDLIPITLTK